MDNELYPVPEESQPRLARALSSSVGALGEYNGAGAFVFWDGRDGKDTIKLFKGASLYYENDKDVYIERPLFALYNKNSFWFSSMEESLDFINDTNTKVIDIECNVLFTIRNGKIISEDKIDRSKMRQTAVLAIDYKKRQNTFPVARGYQEADEYEFTDWQDYDGYGGVGYGSRQYSAPKPSVNSGKAYRIAHPGYNVKDKIFFDTNGLYMLNGSPCEGEIQASPAGYVTTSIPSTQTFYFVMGVLMKSYFDYLCALQYINQNFDDESDCLESYLGMYSPTPTPWSYVDDSGSLCTEFYSYNHTSKKVELCNEPFEPFFNYKKDRYITRNGDITWRYEFIGTGSFYVQPESLMDLDRQILSGQISKNELKKMIKMNLRTTYAKN